MFARERAIELRIADCGLRILPARHGFWGGCCWYGNGQASQRPELLGPAPRDRAAGSAPRGPSAAEGGGWGAGVGGADTPWQGWHCVRKAWERRKRCRKTPRKPF